MTCSTCGSRQPHLHPAVQFEGEVQVCGDSFHDRITPQNTPERIARTKSLDRAAGEGGVSVQIETPIAETGRSVYTAARDRAAGEDGNG